MAVLSTVLLLTFFWSEDGNKLPSVFLKTRTRASIASLGTLVPSTHPQFDACLLDFPHCLCMRTIWKIPLWFIKSSSLSNMPCDPSLGIFASQANHSHSPCLLSKRAGLRWAEKHVWNHSYNTPWVLTPRTWSPASLSPEQSPTPKQRDWGGSMKSTT